MLEITYWTSAADVGGVVFFEAFSPFADDYLLLPREALLTRLELPNNSSARCYLMPLYIWEQWALESASRLPISFITFNRQPSWVDQTRAQWEMLLFRQSTSTAPSKPITYNAIELFTELCGDERIVKKAVK